MSYLTSKLKEKLYQKLSHLSTWLYTVAADIHKHWGLPLNTDSGFLEFP